LHYRPTKSKDGSSLRTKIVVEIRWDEKAGLQTGCCTLPSYRRALSTRGKGDRQ
jgi:hypothetical protein